VLGSIVGLAIGGAYLAGGLARAAVTHAQIAKLATVTGGYSDTALEASLAHDPGALVLARRHGPFTSAEAEASERRLMAYGARLQARLEGGDPLANDPMLQRAALTTSNLVTPARPFHLRGALEGSRDIECLTQAVYYEARGETPAGQRAVAQVVLNRTRHSAYPNTVCAVVFQRTSTTCQFSFACDGSANRPVDLRAWRRAEQVAAKALDGAVMAEVGNATHFHVARISPSWSSQLHRVNQIGSHIFYRFGGRAGGARAFTEAPEPSEAVAAHEPQQVYASLSLAPLANSVAHSMAAGAEVMMQAAGVAKGEKLEAAALPTPAVEPTLLAVPPAPVAASQPTAAPAS